MAKKPVKTPKGTYESIRAAAIAHNLSFSRMSELINSRNHPNYTRIQTEKDPMKKYIKKNKRRWVFSNV